MTIPATTSPPVPTAPPTPRALPDLAAPDLTPTLADMAPPAPAQPRLLLAGASAAAIQLPLPPAAIEEMPTLLDAVLSAGEPRLASVSVVAAAVSRDIDQLESATRALRKVYPTAHIYLLCEPPDETRCRKARAWGATDYLILPLDAADTALLASLVAPPAPRSAARPAIARPPARPSAPDAPAADAPHLDLSDHAALLLQLAAGHPDAPARAVELLASRYPWPGELRFIPADPGQTEMPPPADPAHLRAPVAAPDSPALFGTLTLELRSPDPTPTSDPTPVLQHTLEQSADFLAAVHALTRRFDQLRTLATTDELSGAFNRRYFNAYMLRLLEEARENRFRVTLLMFDIDDFKKYNDRFGHAAGDAIIRELIKLLRACTRPYDLIARIGGDEFAVVFRDNEAPRQANSEHPRDAIAATDRFRKAIQNHQWPAACNIHGDLSISGGLASFPWDADTLPDLMAKADEALLQAKAAGKSAIHLHGAPCRPASQPTE